MKIGLVRHFKVDYPPQKKFMNSEDFQLSMDVYDSSPVIKKETGINPDGWDICYSSTMPRAITTAEKIYSGEIVKTGDITEVQMYPRFQTDLKYPSILWRILARIAWYKSHPSQSEDKQSTADRIERFYRTVITDNKKNILVVTHGFFMRLLAERLIKEGFKGKYEAIPRNGTLYTFER
jgi:broad specificity phosphatase PhoE